MGSTPRINLHKKYSEVHEAFEKETELRGGTVRSRFGVFATADPKKTLRLRGPNKWKIYTCWYCNGENIWCPIT